jgi:hypothetical protein
MIRLALALAAGYAGYKLAYHSEDGRHYGETGDRTLRAGLALFFAALGAGVTYAALVIR